MIEVESKSVGLEERRCRQLSSQRDYPRRVEPTRLIPVGSSGSILAATFPRCSPKGTGPNSIIAEGVYNIDAMRICVSVSAS